ncbi:MAG: DNA polymerase I, partial [Oligoflexales bacterium]|nr:DNA polymerase I [Oligoflexales bacterium]
IDSGAKFESLLNELLACSHFCFDTETTGLDIKVDKPIGISFSLKGKTAFYLPLVRTHAGTLDINCVIPKIKKIFEDKNKLKIGHNIKFDIQMLSNLGIPVEGPLADTMIAAHLLESNLRSYGLDACCLRYLDYAKIPSASLIGHDASISMLNVDIDRLTTYACEDADLTLRLYDYLYPLLEKQGLLSVFHEIEMPLVPILAQMEQEGIFVDAETLLGLSEKMEEDISRLTDRIHEIAGESFNINSTKQLQHIIFEKLKIHEELGITKIPKTKSGYSTNFTVLEQLAAHPLAQNLLEYRSITKLKSTYVDSLPQIINKNSGRVHTSFHQTGTATGRLSSSDPNIQNIPIRSALGKEIRKSFRAKDASHSLFSADYSQIELRLLAHLAKENNLIEAFASGKDIHTSTASKIFSVAPKDVTPDQRSQAKAINFGIIYGMGPQRLAKETGVSLQEAKNFIEKYFESYPGIRGYVNDSIAFAREHEFTVTISGRRRPLPEINGDNKLAVVGAQNIAVNSPVQGSAADLIKIAMIKVQKNLLSSNLHAKMLLQVHDELVFECPNEELEAAMRLVKETMENAMKLDVPLVVDIGHGVNWLEAH